MRKTIKVHQEDPPIYEKDNKGPPHSVPDGVESVPDGVESVPDGVENGYSGGALGELWGSSGGALGQLWGALEEKR